MPGHFESDRVVIPATEVLKSPRTLFDTAKVAWILETPNDDYLGEATSIFRDSERRRMVISLGSQPQDHEGATQAYYLVLDGKLICDSQGETRGLSFFGPVRPEAVKGDGTALVISFSGQDFGADSPPPTFTLKHNISLAKIGRTDPSNELKKEWLTGNWGIFSPDKPGFNRFVSLGLCHSTTRFVETTPTTFEMSTFQVFIPIPTEKCSIPEVKVKWQVGGDHDTGSFASTTRYGPLTLGGVPDNNFGNKFYQQKEIAAGSLLFLVHVLDKDGKYQKNPGPNYDLRSFVPDVGTAFG